MQGTRAVQVVLGEGEPGILRLILEAQGFHVVAHARTDDDLRRVVELTDPSVIVLDAGISALAAEEVQIRSDGVPIVVVWPKDAVSAIAEERVDPAAVILDLGNAVRRVAERHPRPPAAAPTPRAPALAAPEITPAAPPPPPRRRTARRVGVVAAGWAISILALGAVSLALPAALRVFDAERRSFHTLAERPDRADTPDREAPADVADARDEAGGGGKSECAADPSRTGPAGTHEPAAGCGVGNAHGRDRDRGRPEDPGRSSGRGDQARGEPPKATEKEHPEPPTPAASKGDGSSSGAGEDHGGGNGASNRGGH